MHFKVIMVLMVIMWMMWVWMWMMVMVVMVVMVMMMWIQPHIAKLHRSSPEDRGLANQGWDDTDNMSFWRKDKEKVI